VSQASSLAILAPVAGRVVALDQVPDPTFAQAILGPGAAIDPPRTVVDAIAPISGKLLKVFPHAYVILAADGLGVLVHLGIDTVQLKGAGFTLRAAQGDDVTAGDVIVTYDVASVVAAGRNPIVPVIVMEQTADTVALAESATGGADLSAGDPFLAVTR